MFSCSISLWNIRAHDRLMDRYNGFRFGNNMIFPCLEEDNLPLGLPVYVNGVSRDGVFNGLGSAGIGLTIHWKDVASDRRLNHNPAAVDISNRILTLVIDQRASHKQLDHLACVLKDCLRPPGAWSISR